MTACESCPLFASVSLFQFPTINRTIGTKGTFIADEGVHKVILPREANHSLRGLAFHDGAELMGRIVGVTADMRHSARCIAQAYAIEADGVGASVGVGVPLPGSKPHRGGSIR